MDTRDRLKNLREELGISLAQMAQATDVTEAQYEQLEGGNADLSFTFLFKCAQKLGVDISALVTGDEPRLSAYTLTRKGEGMPIKRREGFEYAHIAYLLKDRLAEPFVVTAKYSKKLEDAPIDLSTHSGQELDFVLSGALKVKIGEHVETLHAGDSVYYDAQKPHGMVAMGGEDCVFLSIVVKGDPAQNIVRVQQQPAAATAHTDLYAQCIYKNYVREAVDTDGMLTNIAFDVPQNFNFAYDIVDEIARKQPDKLAMMWVDARGNEKRFSFADMAQSSAQAANYFAKLGIRKGDRVMVVLRRHYQFWFTLLGLHKLGAVAIPATDLLTEKDFLYRFEKAGVSALVCTAYGDAAQMAERAMQQYDGVKVKMIVNGAREGWLPFDADTAQESTEFERVDSNAQDPMLMYFTSGTTGYPKIVVHSFAYPLGHVVTARWWHNVRPDGLHFTVSDTGWAKAMWGKLYGQWLCEAAIFTCDFEKFNPVDILPMFAKYGITTFCAPPTIYRFFIKEDLSKFDLSSLTYATIAGEALNPEVYQQFYNATGLKLMEGFGQTELTLTIANLTGMEPKPGSMGKPSPQYDVRLINDQGENAAPGEVGEIVVYTKEEAPMGMFAGYYLDEDKTRDVWSDGVYHTGDVAWMDEDGYYWYEGRTDDLIKSSGYRIGPFEIESVLMEMPCVTECAVTGIPDEVRGQLVKATVVLTNGYEPSDALKKEIQDYVKHRTAPYKYPRVVEFVPALPKTISGKIRRVELRS